MRGNPPASSNYRTDIDGLRAVAVLAVILFHFAGHQLPSGYLGVDVFFVISGYLITQVIWQELGAQRFTLAGFYERRIRRIVPALLAVLACSCVIAVVLLLPSDLVGFAKALLATLAFGSNVYAWHDTGYFSPLAALKPLLHTWSLGVEEQFYIVFPLILGLLARRWPRFTLPVLIAITLASFGLNLLALQSTRAVAAFYLLPPRAWELGIGAIVALLPDRSAPSSGRWIPALFALLGLAMIALALSGSFTATAPATGEVLAVTGTALLLGLGKHHATPISRLLGAAPLMWTGLISYSLYLWHWPIMVFSQYYLVRDLQPLEIAGTWVCMFGLAWLSWRFVEQPFRRREYPVRRLYVGASLATLVLAIGGFTLWKSGGLSGRLGGEAAVLNSAVGTQYRCGFLDLISFANRTACVLNLPSRSPRDAQVVLFGSSHAQMYAPVWRDILEQRKETGLLVTMVGCLPTTIANFGVGCAREARLRLDALDELPQVRTVVLGLTWFDGPDDLVDAAGQRLDNRDHTALIAALDDLIARLRAKGRQVVLVGPIAVPGWNVASELSRQLAYGRTDPRPLGIPGSEFAKEYAAVFSHFSGREDVRLTRPDIVQCASGSCRYVIDGRSLFADNTHIAAAETGRFREVFAAALEP